MTEKWFLSQSFHKTFGVHLAKPKDVEGPSIFWKNKNKGSFYERYRKELEEKQD